MNLKRLRAPLMLAVIATALLALAPGFALAKSGRAKARTFEGTVSAVARDHRSFRIARPSHASVRIRVARSTELGRGAHVKRGQALGVRARKSKRGWVAVRITRSTAKGQDESTSGDDGSGVEDDPTALGDDPAAEGEDPGDGVDDSGDDPTSDG